MSMIAPSVGDVAMLSVALHKVAAGDLKLHLYKNDYTPTKTDTVSNYTESTATGYASVTMTGASWTVGTTGGVTTAVYPQQTFTYTAAESVCGYYITDSAGTTIWYAQRFANPENFDSAGGSVLLTVNVTLN